MPPRCAAGRQRAGIGNQVEFFFDVEKPAASVDAIFEQAQAAEERSDIATAERLYRRVMTIYPADPAAPFNLGNVLRSSGRTLEGEAAYRAAVRADPNFASAWYNLAHVLDDQRRINEAIECLERALDADPTYADAMFNMGLFLQRLESGCAG
jgi:tetratricopeptide (TPR) repeat protein